MRQLRFLVNKLLGKDSIFEFSLLGQPVTLGIVASRELKRAKEINLESELVEKMREHLRPGDTIFDIGANIGLISILLARHPSGENSQVHSFEPEPRNFAQLERNLSLNNLSDRVSAHQMALGNNNGEVILHVRGTAGEGRHSISTGKGATDTISVPIQTLAEFSRNTGVSPDVLKIDVEGAEGQVLAGMEAMLANQAPRDIFMEIHDKGDGFKMPGDSTIDAFLVANHYKLLWQNKRGSGEHRHYRHQTGSATDSQQLAC